ncbi:Kinase, CAMK CAMKL [Spironucleus salmonicida]|uniref:Kinase, CAMK CAMKL n=1 Tax=Spironucleus salmonicida TaxID=348837 RepID=V6LL55_9EUKA|nr:Kinase, CAMK CAMKL [Spironucleus salmonicida]|eukprot:EST45098.1 Kinase, CAMK CAMKL [Spironucleus salmonicida]
MTCFTSVEALSRYRYKFIKQLGEGGQGKVGLYDDVKNDIQVAIKCYDIKNVQQDEINFIKREFQILLSINQTNVIKCQQLLNNKDYLFLVQEVIQGQSLMEVLNSLSDQHKQDSFIIDQIYYLQYTHIETIVVQLLFTLHYLHEKKIIHRDIKLDNVMYSFVTKKATLIDFGCAKSETKMGTVKTILGTIDYMSPEMLFGQKYTDSTDIWSLGVLIYKLLTNLSPFKPRHADNASLFNKIKDADFYPLPENVNQYLEKIVKECLTPDIALRPSASQLLLKYFSNSTQAQWIQLSRKDKSSYRILSFNSSIKLLQVNNIELLVEELESITITESILRKYQAIYLEEQYQLNVVARLLPQQENLLIFSTKNKDSFLFDQDIKFHQLQQPDIEIQILLMLSNYYPGNQLNIGDIVIETKQEKGCC